MAEKSFGILEIIMIPHNLRSNDVTCGNGRTIMDGDYSKNISCLAVAFVDASDNHGPIRPKCSELLLPLTIRIVFFQTIDLGFGEDDEERRVYRVNAFAKDGALPATLPAVFQESVGGLEVVAIDCRAEGLRRFQRCAVFGVDVSDPSL